jgi:hypothetical protein
MSATVPPPAMPDAPAEPIWAKPIISGFALGIFVLAYAVAYLLKDEKSLLLMSGAAIGLAQQVVGYWVGSSASSTRKDATIAAVAGVATVKAPPP